ncbi:TonB-dependent receptor [Sphingobium sp. BYY-5]|uniref:TonB-dependent receptor n=1 Tax=Sphingobium sp. BYY-5 TaxID=2926400 RepID=UPI001FA7E21B|nr:TonB-dependent receptor [Sphingobium sp. BYY-5]MCI4591865.1 TonB-dependent receptor [Sphingobium sp. BYY-5]
MFKNLHMPSRAELLAGISLASVALGCSTAVHAQDAAAQQTDDSAASEGDIVVTGVRASLSSAQSIKRNSDVIVDSIVAEDIGKLPDRNIAEALQRIPGIQVQRQYGEGSSVAIRGLTQVRTELNGRDIFTASGANQLSLEDIPSELLAGIDVYKNPSADLIEDQLSGTINFRTRKPFDFDGFKAAAAFTQSYFDLTDKFRPSASLLLSDRWDTGIGEIGVLASVSYQKTAFRQDTISTEPFYTLDPSVPADAAVLATLGRTGQTTTLPHGTGIGEVYGDRRRLGTDIAVQWRPSDTLELTAEVFRSDYKFRFDDYSFFAYTSNSAIVPQPGAPFTYADNGDFQSGTFINLPTGNNTSAQTRHSTTTDYSLNLKWKPTANLTVTADGQYVDAKTKNLRSILGLEGTADTLYQDLSGSVPVVNIGSATGLTNPASYDSAFYLDNLNESKASDKTARLDAEYRFDAGILSSIKAGLRYADRRNKMIDTGYRYSGLPSVPTQLENVDLSNFFRGDADLFGNIIAFNRGIIRNYQDTLDTLGIAGAPAYVQSGTNQQRQKTYTGYVSAFFKADPVDGNIGVRVVRTNLDVSGYYQQTSIVLDENGNESNGPTVFNPIAASRDYTSVLPSLNLRVHLTDNLQLRLAAAKNISRPSFTELNPSLTITEPGKAQQNQLHLTSGGNPNLKPMKSDNLDASLEWYFSRTGSLTAAAFYKNIHNYIQTAVSTRTVTFDNGNSYDYQVTSYDNVTKGKVKGFELAYQQFFDFLPGPLKGLGMQANFTYVDSQAPSPATSGPVTNVPLEMLSKYNYNLVGIYELGGLSARVAYNWRSKYVVTTAGNGTGNLPIFNKPFGQLDASISYNVTPKFALALDGVNLTNTRRSTYFGIDTRPRDVVVNDRRISLTARITY